MKLSSAWFAEQRWFAAKDRPADPGDSTSTTIDGTLAVSIVPVGGDRYQLVTATDQPDSLNDPRTGAALARAFSGEVSANGPAGSVQFHRVDGRPINTDSVRSISGEQSNSSLVFNEKLILKVLRRVEAGPHPEVEMLSLLRSHDCDAVPALCGWYEMTGGAVDATLGVLTEFAADGVDGWQLVLDGLAINTGAATPLLRDVGPLLHDLGRRLASIHRILGSVGDDPAFTPASGGPAMAARVSSSVVARIAALRSRLGDDAPYDLAGMLDHATQLAPQWAAGLDAGPAIRHHGDLHLGQTLHSPRGWLIIDWEGEPARPLTERRSKQSPLRDVAGLLRSLSYAAATHARNRSCRVPTGWLGAARAAFLDGYLLEADPSLLPPDAASLVTLLKLLELEKVVYEIDYESANRPDWLAIPVDGLRSILEARTGES